MVDYLRENLNFWRKPYVADNVESFVFRVFGRVFRTELGIDGSNGEKLLDFGCGSGATLNFFKSNGFDVYGVDISEPAIRACKDRMPEIMDHFRVIDPKPRVNQVFFEGGYDVITAIQSLYYFDDNDFSVCLESLYRQLKPGGIIYASMIGKQSGFYENSVEFANGLRTVNMKTTRLDIRDYHVNFTLSMQHIEKKFSQFEKLHVGYYSGLYLEEEGPDFHYTFIGRKWV